MGTRFGGKRIWAGAAILTALATAGVAWSVAGGEPQAELLKTVPLAAFRQDGLIIEEPSKAARDRARVTQAKAEGIAATHYAPGTVVRETALAIVGAGKDACVCWVVVATPLRQSIPVNGTFEMNEARRKELLDSLVSTWQIDFVNSATGEIEGTTIGGSKVR